MELIEVMIGSLEFSLGLGHIVEIDETRFGKKKYQRGRLLNTQ